MQPEQSGIRTWQWVVTVIVIIVLILLGYYMFKGNGAAPVMTDTTPDAMTNTAQETNHIVVTDQFPGNIVYLSSVELSNPGFVVVKNDKTGTPGDILGSQYFNKGINPGKVTLTKSTTEGALYYAVIYADTDGNKIFDATKDMPVKDSAGNVIMKTFRASFSITEPKG